AWSVLPQAGVGVELVAQRRRGPGDIRRIVGRVRRGDRQNLEDCVREVDERLELVVALRGGTAVELDRVGVAEHKADRSARWDRNAVELGAGDRITALRYQVLDVNLARRWREHASGAVGGDDVIAARRVIGRCDLVDLDFEVRVGAGARGNRRDEKRGERARAQIDVRVGRIPDESGGDVGGRGRAANARADGEEFRARDRGFA